MTLINAGNLHLDKRCTSPNSGYTAKHRSAQIAKATSYVRKTLSEMPRVRYNIVQEVNKNEELWGSKKEKEKEIEEMRKLGESAGIRRPDGCLRRISEVNADSYTIP